MFYDDRQEDRLRFGDVLRGFVFTIPKIEKPISKIDNVDYNIDIKLPVFSVVVSPCCSIKNEVLSLSPFIPLLPGFFRNPFFVEDLTRINKTIYPKQAVPPEIWDQLPPQEKEKRLTEGQSKKFRQLFIYKEHESFSPYELHMKEGPRKINTYMINFQDIYKINCSSLKGGKGKILDSKYLQLTVHARQELRDKIASYYGKPPREDKVLLEEEN